jgi:hypothetical protein
VALLLCAPEVAPIVTVLESVRAHRGPTAVHGVAPGLVVDDPTGWRPASRYADGSALPELVAAAADRWGASPAAAAALAWKSYTYWLLLPAVIGYATAGRVPDLSPNNVLVQVPGADPFLRIGLRRPDLAVLPGDPLAGPPDRAGSRDRHRSGDPGRDLGSGIVVTSDLAGHLRRTALDGHLDAVLDGLRGLVHVGRRTLLGSLASGVAYGLTRSVDAMDHAAILPAAHRLLAALGVADLVEIDSQLGVRRRTCCLAFTLPQPKICSGCCIRS